MLASQVDDAARPCPRPAGDPSLLAVFLMAMVKESLYQQLIGTRTFAVDELVDEIFESVQHGMLLVHRFG